jgi:hypothetical protein
MFEYPFPQLMPHNQLQSHGASLQLNRYSAKVSNIANGMIVGTAGGATLADSSVVPSKRSQATTFLVTSRSQTKVAVRQLGKEGN